MEGYLGLFLSAFLAATILPFSSEVILAGLAASGKFATIGLLLAASIGNTLGAVVNWGLGRFCLNWQDRRWFPVKQPELDRAGRWFNRYGVWSLLLAWVPIIGDPLTFAAGVMRVPFVLFLVLVAIAKTGRYLVLLGALSMFTSDAVDSSSAGITMCQTPVVNQEQRRPEPGQERTLSRCRKGVASRTEDGVEYGYCRTCLYSIDLDYSCLACDYDA